MSVDCSHSGIVVVVVDASFKQFVFFLNFPTLLFEPNAEVYSLPAWDCVPYDRLSPHGDITGERISTLSKLASRDLSDKKVVILLTINSFLQKIPPKSFFSIKRPWPC